MTRIDTVQAEAISKVDQVQPMRRREWKGRNVISSSVKPGVAKTVRTKSKCEVLGNLRSKLKRAVKYGGEPEADAQSKNDQRVRFKS